MVGMDGAEHTVPAGALTCDLRTARHALFRPRLCQSRTATLVRRTTSSEDRHRACSELRTHIDYMITRKESETGDDLFSRQIARPRQEGTIGGVSVKASDGVIVSAN
jgi:hypothetical protein